MAHHILAIDAGTTGVTALVLGEDLTVQGRASQEFHQHYPRPGWVEHDPEQIWQTTRAVARKALRAAKAPARGLAAVGVTDQRETTVVWDRRTGRPIHPAIVWQDRRTAARCAGLRDDWQKKVTQRTGLVLDPYFSATKVEWILDKVRGSRDRAASGQLAFGTIDSWLAWKMTGEHVTDDTNASRTLLWDIHRSRWDPELLELFGVPEAMLPDVRPSSGLIADARKDLAGAPVPLAALVGDQQAALFGQRCFEAGHAKNTYGTGCFLLQHTGTEPVRSRHGLLSTRAASLDGTPRYALEGSVFMGGAAVQWLRDGLKLIDSAPAVNERAAEGEDSGGVVVVPAFAGLGAPHWDAQARGAIFGLTRGVSRRHIARATLEAIAFQSLDVLEAMAHDAGTRPPALRVDGGACQSDILMQFQADLLGRPVERPANVETTGLGAAMLAGLAVGTWDLDDLTGLQEQITVFKPRARRAAMDARVATWHQAVAACRAFKPDPDATE